MGYRAVLLPSSRHPLLDSGVHAVQKGCVGIGWNSGHLFRAPPYTADGRRGLSVRVVCSRDQTVKRTLVLLMINQNSTPTPLQIHEKEEEEFNEKSEHDSGINEEPLLTADQVWILLLVLGTFCSLDQEKV